MLDKLIKKFVARKWYCKKCGQLVGHGKKPDRCERCGSNRLSTSDPME